MKTLVLLPLFAVTMSATAEPPINTTNPLTSIVATDHVSFTLRNNSLRSIPLLIPGVMNPNLSPVSNSGVSLTIGQKIYYRHKGKKRVVLTVDESLEGKTIYVNELIKQLEKEW